MKLYHKNPRQITERQYKLLAGSLDELGDLSGIVHDLNTDEIISGNQRSRVFDIYDCEIVVEYEQEPDRQGTVGLGYVVWQGNRYTYRQVRWTAKQCAMANIKANRLGGEWNFDTLANEFDLGDLLEWGFEERDLELDLWHNEPPEDPGPQIDRAEELQEKWQVERGQVWEIGRHRLMCGDSTDAGDVGKLMGGKKARLVYTDPPYGVDYDGGTMVREKLSGDANPSIYGEFLPLIGKAVEEKAPLYLWHSEPVAVPVLQAVANADYAIRALIIWNKNQAQFGALSAQYKQKHEPCWYLHRQGVAPYWYGPTNEVTAWDIDRDSANKLHPTQKPAVLARRALGNSSKQGDTVLDLFVGSGSTLIACEQTNRVGYGMEIEPKYCAVTLERLTGMGLEARLIEG